MVPSCVRAAQSEVWEEMERQKVVRKARERESERERVSERE